MGCIMKGDTATSLHYVDSFNALREMRQEPRQFRVSSPPSDNLLVGFLEFVKDLLRVQTTIVEAAAIFGPVTVFPNLAA